MAQIKQPLQDVLTKLASLQVLNSDQMTVPVYARVWNNQLKDEEGGRTYDFPKPAAFVEILNGTSWEVLGQGYRNADLAFRIHLVHEFYNNEGTFEQDLGIFDLRDSVVSLLHLYCPSGCGPLCAIREEQDYEHKNLYGYIVEFVCNFVDDAGNVDKNFIFSTPPTDLAINGTFNQ
jgi:hypothetical protein